MEKDNNSPSFISSIYFTISIFIVFLCSIIAINFFTSEDIKERKLEKEYEIISSVIGTDFNNDPVQEKTIIPSADGKEKMVLYPVRQDGLVTSVVIKVGNERGYGGYMELVVGFFLDGTIYDYRIISHNETLGLGSKITEPEFCEQFQWFNPERQTFKVTKDGGDIDAITSATISSRAVVDSIQKAHDAYKIFILGE